MSATQELIPATKAPSLVTKFADRYGVEANKLVNTLKATCFKGDVTNEQLMALLIVADQHGLNPWTKEIHAFDDRRGGIVPVVGVDGWARIINEHPQFDGMDFEQDDEKCTCRMYRKDRTHPTVVTEYMIECKRGTSGPWQTHPKRMLRHKTMIQCARIAFSFAGIYDADEAERIIESDAIDVTPDDALSVPEGTKSKRIGHKQLRETVEAITKATENGDGPGLLKVWDQYDNEQKLYIWGSLRAWERRAFKELEDKARKNHIAPNDIGPWAAELLKTTNDPGAAWKAIEDAYAENDQSPPTDLETIYLDRKRELGIQ